MPSSSADAIAQSLNEQFQADNVYFQIVEHSQVLHVYLNHQPGDQIDYARLTNGIQQAVVSQFSGPADGFWLYSRELGNTQPNWQTYIQTPRHAISQSSATQHSPDVTGEEDGASLSALGGSPDESPTDMVQLTGSTAEMQKVIGFAAISQTEANAATEIAGSKTTVPSRVKAPQDIAHSHPEDDAATEIVPGGLALGHSNSPSSNQVLDEHSKTEMVPLERGLGEGSLPSEIDGNADEEAATEMVSFGSQSIGQLGQAMGEVDESLDEHSATEMVPLGNVRSAMSSFASQNSGGVSDEESATEMVPLAGTSAAGLTSFASPHSAVPDEESATEMVPLGGAQGSVLSSFASQPADAVMDEESATEVVPLGASRFGGGLAQSVAAARPTTVPASAEDITLALDRQFQPEMLRFQVTMREGQWHICANRSADAPFDFDRVGDRVRREFQNLVGSTVEAFWFYSRAAGQQKTERKALIQLTEESAVQPTSVAETSSSGAAASTANQVGGSENSGGSLDDRPNDLSPSADTPSQAGSGAPTDLSQYCFVRNRLLLQGKLLPPSDQVARLLETFHKLSDSDKMEAIESVDRIFKGQKPLTAGSDWLQELEGLSDPDLRKAAIWFSRYCEQPTDTIEQIKGVLNAPKAAPPSSKPASQPTSSTGLPAYGGTSYQSPYSPEAYQPAGNPEDDPSTLGNKSNYPKWLRFALPLAWAVYMAVVVFTGSSSNLYSFDLPACQSSASPQACELAALVATPEGVESMATSAPYTPTFEEETSLVNACEQDASFFSGSWDKSISSTLSSVTETLPGVYLVDIQYPDPSNSSGPMVRTACVASLDGWGAEFDDSEFDIPDEWAEELSGPQVFALDEIPLAWPATPYEGNSFVSVINDVGLLLNPFFWAGLNVFFAAVGLLLISSLKIGVAAGSLETILIVATLYGALDSVLVSAFAFVPFFGLLTSPFRRFALLSVAGSLFKDFMLDRNNLLKLVMGMLLLFFIQFIGKFAIGFMVGFSAAISAFS